MAFNFKNLNAVPTQAAPTENTTVMAFENGSPRQIPAGEFGGKGLVVDLRGYTLDLDGGMNTISDIAYDPIYEAIMAGQNVVFQIKANGIDSFAAPLISSAVPGSAFMVVLANNLQLNFTNGSYHTTA
ncbi:MAG: hypothetical protein PUJ93_02650 [Oscillospiraceae bacterium]|nr:hypothetical protein [Oscillospiraceae bacterium]MDY5735564.1 hypothetical protein [Oscillospiraceae bacterium]